MIFAFATRLTTGEGQLAKTRPASGPGTNATPHWKRCARPPPGGCGPKGSFFFCWPARQLDQAWQALGQAGMAPRRLRFVHHRPGAHAYLALVEARRGAGEQQVLAPLFLQDEEGRETGEYCRIYHRSPRDTEGG